MTFTTGGPPSPGITWQALIFKSFGLSVDPELVMRENPQAAFNLAVTPSLEMRPPSKFRIRLAPMIAMGGGSDTNAAVDLAVSPRLGFGNVPATAMRLRVTPAISMNGRDKERGTFALVASPSLGMVGVRQITFDAVGAGVVSNTSPVSFTDTIPTDAAVTLIWVASDASVTSPTMAATLGGSAATLVQSVNVSNSGTHHLFLNCYSVLNPPTGSQAISFTTTGPQNCVVNTVHYRNVSAIGTPITTTSAQAGQPSLAASSTNRNYMYVNAFSYVGTTAGQTFTAYNQNQRYLKALATGNHPIVIGDAPGNGGSLTFSATRSNTTNNWGGIIVPLIP